MAIPNTYKPDYQDKEEISRLFANIPRAVSSISRSGIETYTWENVAEKPIQLQGNKEIEYDSFVPRGKLPVELDFLSRRAHPQAIALARVKAAIKPKKRVYLDPATMEPVNNSLTDEVESFYNSLGLNSKLNERFLDDILRQGAMNAHMVFEPSTLGGSTALTLTKIKYAPYSAYRIPIIKDDFDLFGTESKDSIYQRKQSTKGERAGRIERWNLAKKGAANPYLMYPNWDEELDVREEYNRVQSWVSGTSIWDDYYYAPTWFNDGYIDILRDWLALSKLGSKEISGGFRPMAIMWIYSPIARDLEDSQKSTLTGYNQRVKDYKKLDAVGRIIFEPTDNPELDGTITEISLKGNFKNYTAQDARTKEAICAANNLPYDVLFKSQGTSINNDNGGRLKMGNEIWEELQMLPALAVMEEFYKMTDKYFEIPLITTFGGSPLNVLKTKKEDEEEIDMEE